MRRRFELTVWLALAASGCGGLREESTEIRIGFLADRPSPVAEAAVEAARLAVATVNAAGGIDVGGRPHSVTLFTEDTGNTPEMATRSTLELINREKVVAIVGSSFSSQAIPSGEVAERAGIPMICPGSTHPQTTAGRRYVFRITFIDSLQGRMMARFAREDLGVATAAVLYDIAEAYSRDIAAVFRRVFEEAGGRVVVFESFTSGDRDFTRQLESIRDAEAEALFLPNFGAEAIAQGLQARRLGLDAIFLGSDGWLTEGHTAHRELQGGFFSLIWHRDLKRENGVSDDFVAHYRRAYGHEPSGLAAVTYDAFGVLFRALADAPRIDPESIREALSRIEGFPGVTGPITYRGRGGDPRQSVVIVRIEQDEVRVFKEMEAGVER